MGEEVITAIHANEGVAIAWKPFFRIQPLGLNQHSMPFLLEIWEIINTLAPKIHLDRSAVIIVGTPPFCLRLKSGSMVYSTNTDTIHAYVESLIFIDIQRLARQSPIERRVSITEELAHVYLRVVDEILVMHVVAALCPGVMVKNGVYVIHENPHQ